MDKAVESLNVALSQYHVDVLHEMAEVVGLVPDRLPARKAWLTTELTKVIPKRAGSQDYIRSLSEPERALLAFVLGQGGASTLREVARPLLLAGLVRIEGEGQTASRPELKELVTNLMRRGLLINLVEVYGASKVRTWDKAHRFGIAPEVRRVLPRALLTQPQPDPAVPWLNHEAPPFIMGGSFDHFMRMLFFAWAEIRRQPARQLKSGGVGKRDLRRLAGTLGLDEKTELERVEALYEMLVALKLLSDNGSEISAVDTSATTLFWNATPGRQLHELGRAYARITVNLLDRETRIVQSPYAMGTGHRLPSEVRDEVFSAINQLVTYGWVSFPFLMSYLVAGLSGALVLGEEMLGFVFENLRWYGLSYRNEVEASLQQQEAAFVHACLTELSHIGIVELGYTSSDVEAIEALEVNPEALRVTPGIRTYYEDGKGGDRALTQPWQIILQPDFQLLAMGPVPLRVLSNLNQVAHHEKFTESVVSFRVTRDSVYEAFQRGESVESVKTYLEEAAQEPLPQNVSRSIEEWYGQYERIVVRREVCLVQVDTPDRLEALLEDAKVRRWLHRLGDCVAWVHAKNVTKVEARLAELQTLVAHSGAPDQDLPHSLHLRDDVLEPRAPLPSLYVTGTLSRLAEQRDGQWRVTPRSVQTAVAAGTDPVAIVELLERMTGGALPDEWEQHIKAWGKHYGDGRTAQVRLLRLDRNGALEELRRADARLRRWLRPLPNAENLAAVNETNWEEAVELLQALGVEVKDGRWW